MSAGLILLLEDDDRRVAAMTELCHRFFPEKSVVVRDDAARWIEDYPTHREEIGLIALDHDLPIYRDDKGTLRDHGTGLMAAEYLASQPPQAPVLIHSTNVPAATAMERVLRDSGWHVDRLTPYGDLEWIDEVWWPRARRLIKCGKA